MPGRMPMPQNMPYQMFPPQYQGMFPGQMGQMPMMPPGQMAGMPPGQFIGLQGPMQGQMPGMMPPPQYMTHPMAPPQPESVMEKEQLGEALYPKIEAIENEIDPQYLL